MFLESQNTYITKPLADLCSKIGSGATPKGGKAAYFDKGISLIRSMNVFDYFFSYPELAHISQIQANALANVEIQQVDVLFFQNYICLFNYLFISSQMSAKPYFIGSTGILPLW